MRGTLRGLMYAEPVTLESNNCRCENIPLVANSRPDFQFSQNFDLAEHHQHAFKRVLGARALNRACRMRRCSCLPVSVSTSTLVLSCFSRGFRSPRPCFSGIKLFRKTLGWGGVDGWEVGRSLWAFRSARIYFLQVYSSITRSS